MTAVRCGGVDAATASAASAAAVAGRRRSRPEKHRLRPRRRPAATPRLLSLASVAAAAAACALILCAASFASSSPSSPLAASPPPPGSRRRRHILVAGSANADTFLPVARLPREGENLCVLDDEDVEVDVPGGKGCNQAVACARLSRTDAADGNADDANNVESSTPQPIGVAFLGQFGNDPAASILRGALTESGADVSASGTCPHAPSGRGYVFLQRESGKVSAIVSGGSNTAGWGDGWRRAEARISNERDDGTAASDEATEKEVAAGDGAITDAYLDALLDGVSCLLLQREIPEVVNRVLSHRASRLGDGGGITVIQDAGGDDRPLDAHMMNSIDYLVPNESELIRLLEHCREELRLRTAARREEVAAAARGEASPKTAAGKVGRGGGSDTASSTEPAAESKVDNANDNSGVGDHMRQTRPYGDDTPDDPDLVSHLETTVHAARLLQRHYSATTTNVLVTLGSSGSILVPADPSQTPLYCRACSLPEGAQMVDETGAGDCYRAAFAVALCEGRAGQGTQQSEHACMKFASAAGALAVTKRGAVPSIPSREDVEELCRAEYGEDWDAVEHDAMESEKEDREGEDKGRFSVASFLRGVARRLGPHRGEKAHKATAATEEVPRGGASNPSDAKDEGDEDEKETFPFLFGSRLNSMKDRPELCASPPTTVRDWVERQAQVQGLGCVDFNYPQHFNDWTPTEARAALDGAGLRAGSVCLRYPSKFARGALNHPDPKLRREALDLTLEAAKVAKVLGCDEVVIWSAYDGYDYPFQVDYDTKWTELVEAFRECCDAYPKIKWSLEYKPTDENTRFFTVPSTGAAILLVREVERTNFGLVLDVGHMLMAGENPGQSLAMVGQLLGGNKLFGIQLNDGYTRLAAEDGMMFGSVHPSMALEIMYHLKRIGFGGHLYFDTFPQRTDPVKEAEWNIQRAKEFWRAAGRMDALGVREVMKEHDALGALKAVEEALGRGGGGG